MGERIISRRGFLNAIGSLAITGILGLQENEDALDISYEQILRKTKSIDALIHNAEMISEFDNLANDANIHAMEIDIYSLNGTPVIGHSEKEIIRIPEEKYELEETFKRIQQNGFRIHIDLKSPDMGVAKDVFRRLPPGSMLSTPHHELLDELSKENLNNLLLYTINTEHKKDEFDRRLRKGPELTNTGISAHYKYLSKKGVSYYQDNGLYVLAYRADKLETAARLCEYGVNGITSSSPRVLSLLAS